MPEIAGFALHERLGQGGMGEVFRATRESDGRELAVKVLSEALAAVPDYVRRFDRDLVHRGGAHRPHRRADAAGSGCDRRAGECWESPESDVMENAECGMRNVGAGFERVRRGSTIAKQFRIPHSAFRI